MSDKSGVSKAEVQEGGSKWIPVSNRNSKPAGRAAVDLGLGQTRSIRPMETEVSVTENQEPFI